MCELYGPRIGSEVYSGAERVLVVLVLVRVGHCAGV